MPARSAAPTPDPTEPIEALRKRLPTGWTLSYGVTERRDPTHMYVHWIVVTTTSGMTFDAEQAITEGLLANSYLTRARLERAVWEMVAAKFPPEYPGRAALSAHDAAEDGDGH